MMQANKRACRWQHNAVLSRDTHAYPGAYAPEGVPIHRLRRLLQWPRERFDAVLEALRAAQAIDLEPLTDHAVDVQATHDSYHIHGQCYGRLRWRV